MENWNSKIPLFLPYPGRPQHGGQRLLDDRKATVDMLQAEGGRIAQSAERADREKITGQLESLESRWTGLLSKAAAR